MTLTLYTCTAENNRLDKSSYLTSIDSLTGTMLEGSSIDNPGILFYYNGTPAAANYFYISEFGRYYNRTDCIYKGGNCWEIHGKTDPLHSFRTDISGCTAYVDRNENEHNDFLTDNCFPAAVTKIDASLLIAGSGWYGSEATGGARFVAVVQADPDSARSTGAGTTAIVGSAGSISAWVRGLSSIGFASKSAFDYLCRVYALPCVPGSSSAATKVTFPIFDPSTSGDYSISGLGILADGSTTTTFTGNVRSHCGAYPYRAFAPYARYVLHFSPFGSFELDPEIIFKGATGATAYQSATVTLKVILNNITGEAGLYITIPNGDDVLLASACLAVDLPATKEHYNVAAGVSAVGSIAMGAAALASGAAAGAFQITNGIAQLSDMRSTAYQIGGSKMIDLAPLITTHYKDIPETGKATKGLPLCKEKTVSALSGFTVASSIHLDGVPATASEKDQIEAAFAAGVIL